MRTSTGSPATTIIDDDQLAISGSMASSSSSRNDATEINLIVHHFTEMDQQTPSNQTAAILDLGRKMVQAAALSSNISKWKSVERSLEYEHNFPSKGKTTYTYMLALPAPRIQCHRRRLLDQTKEWGSQAEASEIFNLRELEEFRSCVAPMVSSSKSTRSRSRSSSPSDERPPKRLKLEMGSLYSYIPQPHMLPSLYHPETPVLNIRPYVKAKAVAIPPNSFSNFTPAPLSRTAWLVPVRGTFPWEGSTSAAVLSPSEAAALPTPVSPMQTSDELGRILWTQPSLLAFWQFLQAMRNSGNLGSIGISYHVLPRSVAASATSRKSISMMDQGNRIPDLTVSEQSDIALRTVERTSPPNQRSINEVEYIKIYHDATIAMRLRSALDAWKYITPCIGDENKKSEWSYSGLRGSLVFGMDKDSHIPGEGLWFRLIDNISDRVIWVFKIPKGLAYEQDRPFFYTFSGMSRKFGFLFSEDDEATKFAQLVTSMTRIQAPLGRQPSRKSKRSNSSKNVQLSPSLVASPTSNTFVHLSHIGMNSAGSLEHSKNLDPLWGSILADLTTSHGGPREDAGYESQPEPSRPPLSSRSTSKPTLSKKPSLSIWRIRRNRSTQQTV
ncbi:hypothetical protein ONZ45_g9216 [Pleurotus djamor]|nr:hypothetical protein ONZ45_g9216 [Pleurotus djamor]